MADEEVILAEIVAETSGPTRNLAADEVILAEIVAETPGGARPRWLGIKAWIAASAATVLLVVSVGTFGKEIGWIARAFLLAASAAAAVWGLVLLLRRGKTWTATAGAALSLVLCAAAVGLIVASRPAGSGVDARRASTTTRSYAPPALHPQPLPSEPLAIAPQDVDFSLVERIALCDGVKLTTLSPDVDQLAEGYPWSQDGGKLYLLRKNGILLEVQLPKWEVRRQLSLPGDFSHLALCKAGLVLVRRSTGDLVLVDQQTLTAKCRVKLAGVEHVAASPASPLVFAPAGRELRVVDMEALTLQQELETGAPITHPEVTPNGEYFFCAGDYQSAMRQFAVRDGGVVAAGTTSGGINVSHVDVSADSKYAAVTYGGGAQPPGGYPAVSYASYVFNVDDLKPAMALYAGAYPQTVAVDPATGRFYTQNYDHPLIVFSAAGELENAYKWMNVGQTHRLVVHPQGRKLLAISEKRIVWVELPDSLSRKELQRN